MTENKYVIPSGGCDAAFKAVGDLKPLKGWGKITEAQTILEALKAFIRWQSENPPVPTDKQVQQVGTVALLDGNWVWYNYYLPYYRALMMEWTRRMFIAPEPEYGVCEKCGARVQDGATMSHSSAHGTLFPGHTEPEVPEEIKDLLIEDTLDGTTCRAANSNTRVIEAYRRGQKAGLK